MESNNDHNNPKYNRQRQEKSTIHAGLAWLVLIGIPLLGLTIEGCKDIQKNINLHNYQNLRYSRPF